VNFQEAETYLYSLGNEVSAMKLGLEYIEKLLTALGDPQKKYLKVQVAGTNGKGSVCAFLDSICNSAGIATGTFTSPHLISITERVRINGEDVSEKDFARFASIVRDTAESLVTSGELETTPTFFEQVTAIALLAFAEAKVDLAILETGLGGRLDATTAANAEIAAITRIDLDHQEYLGDTIEQIAAEKAAIIRTDSRVIALRQTRKADQAIIGRCREVGVEPRWVGTVEKQHYDDEISAMVATFKTSKSSYPCIALLGMRGRHQLENASIAITIAEELQDVGLDIQLSIFDASIEGVTHPGRLEYDGKFIFDGAHNVGGAKALAAFIAEYEKRPITMVFGAMNDKSVAAILSILAPIAERMVVTEPSNSRSLAYSELLEKLPSSLSKEKTFATDHVQKAITIAREITPADGIILVTGSLYLVGEVKRILSSQI